MIIEQIIELKMRGVVLLVVHVLLNWLFSMQNKSLLKSIFKWIFIYS